MQVNLSTEWPTREINKLAIITNPKFANLMTIEMNGEKMNLQVGGPTNTIVLTENRTGVTLIMNMTLYQLGHASTTKT